MDKISNFKVTKVEGLDYFLKGDGVFDEKEMILYTFWYFVVLGVCWAIWKNWPKKKGMMTTKRLILWSPLFRILMMTWFATALWVFTFYHGAADGFYSKIYDFVNPRVNGKGNGRFLAGLQDKYPTVV